EAPSLDDYRRRFPDLAGELQLQIELHRALEAAADRPGEDSGESAAAPARAPAAGPSVPGYEVIQELGRGGMGVVYLARQKGLNPPGALKMMPAAASAAPDQVTRFQAEAEAAARLQHPNIVEIHEVGEHAGCPYFSMDYLDGGSLAQRLRDGPQPARP